MSYFSRDDDNAKKTGGGGPKPAGLYRIKIAKAEHGKTQNKKEKIALTLSCYNAETKGEDAFDVFDMVLPFEKKARWKLDQIMAVLGLKDLNAPENGHFLDLVGKTGYATMRQEERAYKGEVRAFLRPHQYFSDAKLSAGEVMDGITAPKEIEEATQWVKDNPTVEMSAEEKNRLVAQASTGGAAQQAETKMGDDDLPF